MGYKSFVDVEIFSLASLYHKCIVFFRSVALGKVRETCLFAKPSFSHLLHKKRKKRFIFPLKLKEESSLSGKTYVILQTLLR